MTDGSGRGLGERFVRAAMLDPALYREVSADRTATLQAAAVVVLGGVCSVLGRGMAGAGLGQAGSLALLWLQWVLLTVAGPVIAWGAWTLAVRAVARVFGHRADGRALLRALGFANAPAAALLLRAAPGVGPLVYPAVLLWLLAAAIVAVESVFAVSRRRAVGIGVTGFTVYWLLGVALQLWAGG